MYNQDRAKRTGEKYITVRARRQIYIIIKLTAVLPNLIGRKIYLETY